MNFERVEIDEASLIRKMSRIRFFDSLSCNPQVENLYRYTRFQVIILKKIIFTTSFYVLTKNTLLILIRLYF